MRYGMILPGGTAAEQLEQAVLAEEAGWDGVFVWEAAYGVDAWGLLSAIAARTSRVTSSRKPVKTKCEVSPAARSMSCTSAKCLR